MKNFFVNYRRRFNLEEVLQEWEAEQGTQAPNGDSTTSGEEGKNSSTTPSGKSTDEEDEEVGHVARLLSVAIFTRLGCDLTERLSINLVQLVCFLFVIHFHGLMKTKRQNTLPSEFRNTTCIY